MKSWKKHDLMSVVFWMAACHHQWWSGIQYQARVSVLRLPTSKTYSMWDASSERPEGGVWISSTIIYSLRLTKGVVVNQNPDPCFSWLPDTQVGQAENDQNLICFIGFHKTIFKLPCSYSTFQLLLIEVATVDAITITSIQISPRFALNTSVKVHSGCC